MLTVIVPVHNALPHLKQTLNSLFTNSTVLSELVVVDDYSKTPTQNYIRSITSPDIRVTLTRNPTHSWTNASWNTGVQLSTTPYIAILNSDILLSPDWDTHLLTTLQDYDCACPYIEHNGQPAKLLPIIEEIDPDMIQGSCFMFRNPKHLLYSPFPIPSFLKHWCGDRYLADFWNSDMGEGIGFNPRAVIQHAVSQSAKTVKTNQYLEVIEQDVIAYENYTGKKETVVRREMGW